MRGVKLIAAIFFAISAISAFAHQDLPDPATAFSFLYNHQNSRDFLSGWSASTSTKRLDRERTQREVVLHDPITGLEVRCVSVSYRTSSAIEWTVYLTNRGSQDTLLIEGLRAMDADLTGDPAEAIVLHHNVGSPADGTDYSPIETALTLHAPLRLAGANGRPTGSDLSYFNVSSGTHGQILAVGWPGQWSASIERTAAGVHVVAGQETTHFKLHPGEQIRTPLMVLLPWQGDWISGQNKWRHWMMSYGMPKPGGKLPAPMMLGYSGRAYEEMVHADEASQILFIDRYLKEGFQLDYWWMDAGWYIQKTGWHQVGTWEVDPVRFPHGFKTISAYAHKRGVKILVWFEPERVAPDTWLTQHHPEWLLGSDKGMRLLNLGDPNALNWLTDHIDKLIVDNKIDLYRQDFNIEPLPFWRANDPEDRRGITENKYVVGYLSYWDELRRRHPNMLIDSCASGGRRNDLETMRRSVPLWRSDYHFEPTGQQNMTYGLATWIPYYGTGTVAYGPAPFYQSGALPVVPYDFWSTACPSLMSAIDIRDRSYDYNLLRQLWGNWRRLSPFWYGDFYPLTPFSGKTYAWIAWQFHDAKTSSGFIQAFRRADSKEAHLLVKVMSLDLVKTYQLEVLEGSGVVSQSTFTGEQLAAGLDLSLEGRPSAAVIVYRPVDLPR